MTFQTEIFQAQGMFSTIIIIRPCKFYVNLHGFCFLPIQRSFKSLHILLLCRTDFQFESSKELSSFRDNLFFVMSSCPWNIDLEIKGSASLCRNGICFYTLWDFFICFVHSQTKTLYRVLCFKDRVETWLQTRSLKHRLQRRAL